MAELKTKANQASTKDFLQSVEDETRQSDAKKVYQIMVKVTGLKGQMWGDSIIGFGSYHYKTKSGQEGDWLKIGFSPRKKNLSLYILNYPDISIDQDLLEKLGKYKHGKSCLYINKLSDVDLDVLEELIARAFSR